MMAKLKFSYTRRIVFSGATAYLSYVERLKKRYNAVYGTFNDAIISETSCGSVSAELSFATR